MLFYQSLLFFVTVRAQYQKNTHRECLVETCSFQLLFCSVGWIIAVSVIAAAAVGVFAGVLVVYRRRRQGYEPIE